MSGDEGLLDQSEIDAMLSGASKQETPAPAEGTPEAPAEPAAAEPVAGMDAFKLDEVTVDEAPEEIGNNVNLILDVDLNVRVELGRSRMLIEDVLRLREGSVVPLDKLAGDPVDIFVNGRLMARGEVLVLNDNFCVRISDIVGESAGSASVDD